MFAALSVVSGDVAAAAVTQIDISITSGSDDAEERAGGSVTLTSSDLELVAEVGGPQVVGLRFPDLGIPRDATILTATLQFTVDETNTETTSLTIRSVDADTASPFTTAALDVSSRPVSTARVTWNPPSWNTIGASGPDQTTPNLASLVQVAVSRPGWASGNAIAFIIDGSGKRVADSYEGGASRAPKLHIEYDPVPASAVSTITSLTPPSGSPGRAISINGSGFAGTSQVMFNGEPTTFSLVSDTSIIASIPLTATTGPVGVTNAAGTAFSAADFVVDPVDPLEVPSEYSTIQAAIDASVEGDTVLVAPGTYAAGVVIHTTITLESHYGLTGDPNTIATTIIQSDGALNGLTVASNVGPATTIRGFTITGIDSSGGAGLDGISVGATANIIDNHITLFGDAIDFDPPLPAVASCICKRNTIDFNSDDAIDLDGAAESVIEDNILRDNGDDGIEIRMQDHAGALNLIIRNNLIINNGQDGIQLIDEPGESDRRFLIQGNVIADNNRAGLGLMDNSMTTEDYRAASLLDSIHLINNTFSGNNHNVSGGDNLVAVNNIFVGADVAIKGVDGDSVVAHSLFSGNLVDVVTSNVDGSTRLDADPLLNIDFTLLPGSPAVDAGTAYFEWMGTTVLAATPDAYIGAAPDLGAFGLLDAPDTTPPSVVSVAPADGDIDVAQESQVLAAFSESIDSGSLTSTNFVLNDLGSALPVAARVTYDPFTLSGILTPDQPLAISTTYEATVVGGVSGIADSSGNRLDQDFTWTFTTEGADVTPPETTLDSGPDDPTSETFGEFGFSSDEPGSSFECSLDDVAFTTCVSPQAVSGLQDGSHNFRARATDPEGNVDLSPAIWTWVIDTSVSGAQFPAIGDATVLGADPDANFGTSPTLMSDLSPIETSYLQFDVSGLGGLITSAELRVFATGNTTNGPAVYAVENGWSESLIIYNTAPARISSQLDSSGAIPSGNWVVYDVTQAVLGNGIVSFELAAQSSDGVDFDSREATGSNKPILVVTSVDPVSLPEVTVAATDSAASEPGSDTGTFTITRTGPTESALVVAYSVTGTATPGVDYATLSGSVTLPIGQASVTVTVSPLDDSTPESPESVVLTLTAAVDYLVGASSSGTVTISDDGDLPEVTVAATDSAASEPGSDTGTITITRTGPTDSALVVTYTVGGFATPGVDYTTLSGSATIPIGQASTSITVTPLDDTTAESTESVVVTLASTVDYLVGSPSSGVVTIFDDDPPVVSIAATDSAASEPGTDTGTFTVTRTGPTDSALVVSYTVTGTATPGVDYAALSGSATIPIGQASTSIAVEPLDDTAAESTESVALTLTAAVDYQVGTPSSDTVTISDDGDLPSVSIAATDAVASEPGSDTGTFTITRTGPTDSALVVSYTATGSATPAVDYTTLAGSATIPIGQSATTITITPLNDATAESPESVVVTLSPSADYLVGAPSSGAVTISDDDLPSVTVAATDSAASEPGSDTGTFTVTRTGPTDSALVVAYTVTGTATPGTDYTTLPGSITLPIGQSAATITITPLDDTAAESTESVALTLTAAVDYLIGSPSSSTITISDDGDLPAVSIAATDAVASEPGSDTGTFTITRTGPTDSALVVSYTATGTATPGVDYTTLAGSATIPIGQSATTITITPLNDATAESPESVVVTLSPSADYLVGAPSSGAVTISDDDLPSVTVAATDSAASEPGSDTGTFTVTRTGPTDSALVVAYTVTGTATPGTDYTTLPGSATIPIGQASTSIAVEPLDDTAAESTESVALTLTAAVDYQVGTPSSDTVTISDDGDLPAVSIAATDAVASEPGSDTGTFTITRTGPTDSALVVSYTATGTATPGVDYTTLSGSATIPIGQASTSITVEPLDDTDIESPETVTLSLTADAAYATTTPTTATATINDDDGGGEAESRFTAVADTYIDQGTPATNFGSDTSLSVDGNAGSAEDALVRFDVSGLVGPVQSATLRIYVTNSTSTGPEIITTDTGWDESTVTWNDKPASIGMVTFDTGPIPSGAWFDIDVTSAVSGNGTYSFGFVPRSKNGLNFESREVPSRAPELVVISSTVPDTTPPAVVSTAPSEGASGVSVAATVRATFSEPMDPSTIDNSSFTLSDGINAISAIVSFDSATETASLVADAALELGRTYTATITTVAADTAGNGLAAPVTWTFVTEATDTTPPDTLILLGPTSETTATDATFLFTASEAGSTFVCSLDSAPATPCISPNGYTSLSTGDHSFEVTATDASGNSDPTSATWSWTITSTLTFTAVADTYVTDRRTTTNYGSATSLQSDAKPNNKEIYLRFDVSGISSPVQSAVLRVYITNGSSNGPEVFAASNTWDEYVMTWDTRASRIGAAIVDAEVIPIGGWYQFDLTSHVSADGTYTFNLASVSSDALKFYSREVAGSEPHLIVTTQ